MSRRLAANSSDDAPIDAEFLCVLSVALCGGIE